MLQGQQLDLLSYVLSEQEAAEPATPAEQPKPINRHAIAYYEAKAALYLRLMSQIMKGERLPLQVKRHEISRLYQLREQALLKAEELERP